MAIYPNKTEGQFRMQPGARGEKFNANIPGYRNNDQRINRTNMGLRTNEHDSPNIKYMFDERLPVLFTYGYAYGFNQMVVPKGRLVSVDPYMDLVDFDMQKQHNTLTLANGGVPVRIRTVADKYKDFSGAGEKIVSSELQGKALANDGIEFTPIIGMERAYSQLAFRPFTKVEAGDVRTTVGPLAQLTELGYSIDKVSGRVIDGSGNRVGVIPGNSPIGMLIRNEYTRNEDAFNGIAPGAVNTDCMVELPWFAYKDRAESNPWGSAYGGLFPGALVKSDENGRFVVSPLSFESEVSSMNILEYELERQQLVGQVYAVNTELVPEGAAKWATWALTDRLNFEEFNPDEWTQNNRKGEDSIKNSPYGSTGKYPGYPYDKNYGNDDLHMLASSRENYNNRMQHEFQYENLGIPGLTDGYNAVVRALGPVQVGTLHLSSKITEPLELFFRTPDVHVEDIEISIGDTAFAKIVQGGKLSVKVGSKPQTNNVITVEYCNDLQGLISLKITNLTEIKKLLDGDTPLVLPIRAKYNKRGLAGVPTFMDWNGCVGSVKILLQK